MIQRILLGFGLFPVALTAGTVVVTSLPDEDHPWEALTALSGIPLTAGTVVRVGVFPNMTDDQVLDAAAEGWEELDSQFVEFGSPKNIGDGVDGVAGRFEIAVSEDVAAASPWVGEEVSLIVRKEGGQEFLVARFKGIEFAADPDTGLEQLISLHLADARAITGNRNGALQLATAPAPEVGGFGTWMAGFPAISDPLLKLPAADADGDGSSNFLEYVTGADPGSGGDPQACEIYADGEELWVRYPRIPGMGDLQPMLESSADLISGWQRLDMASESEPEPPTAGGIDWRRVRVKGGSAGMEGASQGFFRLRVGP
jgi:hypothetical protein